MSESTAITTTATTNNVTGDTNAKVCYILRGISGSGKSTLSKQILSNEHSLEEKEHNHRIFSADNYFINKETGKYEFDGTKIGNAHQWCQKRFKEGLEGGLSPVIVDNTNTQLWEMKYYVQLALEHQYNVIVREPETPWKSDAKELAKRNVHGVPEDKIEAMLKRWQTFESLDDILKSNPPKRAQRGANRGRGRGRGGSHQQK